MTKTTRILLSAMLMAAIISCSCGRERTGAVCNDGWKSAATGSGACSHHDGVRYWTYD
jgi:hypothetical protein